MRWFLLALVAAAAMAGCLDNDDDNDPADPTPTPTGTPGPAQEEVSFTQTGTYLGCLGDVNPCLGRQLGPGQEAPDGAWFEINETLWLRPFTTSSDNQLGDTDCYVLDANGEPLAQGEFDNGQEPCGGQMPVDAAWLFLYSYGEPATRLTLTFPAV